MGSKADQSLRQNSDLLSEVAEQAALRASPMRGTICLYAGDQLPEYWAWCDGAEISRADYPNTFLLLGTKFGAGDGETTFNLPQLPDPAPGVRYIIKLVGATPMKQG